MCRRGCKGLWTAAWRRRLSALSLGARERTRSNEARVGARAQTGASMETAGGVDSGRSPPPGWRGLRHVADHPGASPALGAAGGAFRRSNDCREVMPHSMPSGWRKRGRTVRAGRDQPYSIALVSDRSRNGAGWGEVSKYGTTSTPRDLGKARHDTVGDRYWPLGFYRVRISKAGYAPAEITMAIGEPSCRGTGTRKVLRRRAWCWSPCLAPAMASASPGPSSAGLSGSTSSK